ncbi:hypothetical protein QVD17_07865 [Tagetes erecta]|uniref:Transmembrane protein n=1 Tax=Tagetes erecta TaxID=13708 RepID=A0AAD8L267_TARER|nr:hypothetical protein QVD17_07865 [Tagetes erecta]
MTSTQDLSSSALPHRLSSTFDSLEDFNGGLLFSKRSSHRVMVVAFICLITMLGSHGGRVYLSDYYVGDDDNVVTSGGGSARSIDGNVIKLTCNS